MGYLVLMKVFGNNSVGARISSKFIVVVDKDNTKDVKGSLSVDNDFILGYAYVKKQANPDFKIEFDRFNKINTEGMSQLDKFIFEQ